MSLDTRHEKINLTPFEKGFTGYKVVCRNAQDGSMLPVYFDNMHMMQDGGPWEQTMGAGEMLGAFANKPFTYNVGEIATMVPKSEGIFVLPNIADCLDWAKGRSSVWENGDPVIIEVLCWTWDVIMTGKDGPHHVALMKKILVKRLVEHLRR